MLCVSEACSFNNTWSCERELSNIHTDGSDFRLMKRELFKTRFKIETNIRDNFEYRKKYEHRKKTLCLNLESGFKSV